VNTQVATEASPARTRRSARAAVVLFLGPLTVLGGVVWALFQPERITLLHPSGQGFWWLFSEPPLYAILVGLFFHFFVAPGIVADLEQAER
jgi:hypothetical protein